MLAFLIRGFYITLIILILVQVFWPRAIPTSEFEKYYDQKILWTGLVKSEPTLSSGGNWIVIIHPDGFEGSIRVNLYAASSYHQGDRVEVAGKVSSIKNFSDFDYVGYSAKDHIFAEVKSAKLKLIEPTRSKWRLQIRKFRSWSLKSLARNLSSEHSTVVAGMLLGIKDPQAQQLNENFQRTGLVHLLVVSGYNLSVAGNLVGIFGYVIGRRYADYLSLLWVWFFVFLVGFSASVVRAGIMVSILFLARIMGRVSFSHISLLLAVLIMVIINPLIAKYDIGFQLSFAATLGVIYASKIFGIYGKKGFWQDTVAPTLGAIVMTLPIISFYFGTVSLISPIANFVIAPAVPVVMLGGSLVLIPYMGNWVAVILTILLKLFLYVVNWLAQIEFSQTEYKMSGVVVWLYFTFVFLSYWWFLEYQKRKLKGMYKRAKMTKITI